MFVPMNVINADNFFDSDAAHECLRHGVQLCSIQDRITRPSFSVNLFHLSA